MICIKCILTKKENKFLNNIIKNFRSKKYSNRKISFLLEFSNDILVTPSFDFILFNTQTDDVIGFITEEWKHG